MGISSNGIIIRQDNNKFKAEKIIVDFFGQAFIELKESELYDADYKKRFDSRKDECVIIFKTPQFIIIENAKFTLGFYDSEDQTSIKKVYAYFNRPAQIFAFEEYGSGGTYSYSIALHGKLIRYYRSLIDKVPKTYGEPLNIELKYLKARIVKERDEDGEYDAFVDPHSNEHYHMASMPQLLLQEVMGHEVGIYPENIYENAIEKHFFRLVEK
jgi:hypothetical protein